MSDNSETFDENKTEMIEDEEMPTFISVSSKDISLPYTDANIQLELAIDNNSTHNPITLNTNNDTADDYEPQTRSPSTTGEREDDERNDDNEDGSVYVLSSGDEPDEADDPSSRSYDEDVDEEEDVDDEDDEDIDDMDEIDPEEEEVGVTEDGQLLGDFSEDEIEKEDIMSEDMGLRSEKPTTINNEKRSQSLQDLSEYGSKSKRKSFITGGNRYNRVQSKVKRYIQDLKEKSRKSAENRLKIMQENRKSIEYQNKVSEEREEEEYGQKSSKGRRSIKNYAEQVFKDLETREELNIEDEDTQEIYETEDQITRTNCNMQAKNNSKTDNQEMRENNFNCDFKTAGEIYRANKMLNMNGELSNDALKNIKIPKGITLNYTLNGQSQGQNILDVRSIGYDEYMRGSSNSNAGKNLEASETRKKYSQDETQSSKLRITNIRSEVQPNTEMKNDVQTVEETPMEVVEYQEEKEEITKPDTNVKISKEAQAEIASIQSQLNEKTTQCEEIKEAYKKTLSENFELKQELEDLKKTMAKLTAKKPAPQLVAVAIQTDPLPLPLPLPPPPQAQSVTETKDIPATDNFLNQKLSMSSIGSTISTNEHWTESAGSLPLSNGSIRPMPNLTPLSIAEDSFIGVPTTPPPTSRQPSHAFQTSSKIIKMLSSLTQRKSKTDGAVNGEEGLSNIFGKASTTSPGISNYNSPLNPNRVSNKRKASEMPENANFLQPPKIPHTSSGSSRLHRRSKSEFKYPGDYIKPNSQAFTTQSSDANRTLENSEDSRREDDPGDDPDSGVKCFTYRDDENSLETSFLIQAENEAKNQDETKDGERSSIGVVRECGPYLLGNVEVRMTEINGTINIWGKEVSQETTVEDEPEEEAEIEEELIERGSCGCWHKTPNTRFSNIGPMSCSTNKKPKVAPLRLNESPYSKNIHHSPSTSTLNHSRECQHVRNTENDDDCRICNSHSTNSRIVNKFRRFSNFGDEENPNNCCSCNWDNGNCDNASCARVSNRHHHGDHACASKTLNARTAERCSRLHGVMDNEQSKTEENFNRSQASRLTNNFDDVNLSCRHGVRKYSDLEDDVFKRPSTSTARVNDPCCKNESCITRGSSFNNQSTDPLLSHHPHEPPESRRRRSSGKRVRGILMDFLRGCGDCRTTNGPDNKVSPSVIPKIRIRSSTPPPTLLGQNQQRTNNYGSTNKRCVHMECCATCSRRIEMAAEIESQLEIFGAEMERLRSRSQAVLGMLNTLHSADTN